MQKGGSVSYKNELGKLIQSLEIYLQAMKHIDQSIAQLFPNAGDNPRPGIRREGIQVRTFNHLHPGNNATIQKPTGYDPYTDRTNPGQKPGLGNEPGNIWSGFKQGPNKSNCVTVASIKAAMMRFGQKPTDVFKQVIAAGDGWNIQMRDRDDRWYHLSKHELEQATYRSEFSGDSPSMVADANFLYAVSAKRAQLENNDGYAGQGFERALYSINDGEPFGFNSNGFRRLGLGAHIRKVSAANLADGRLGLVTRGVRVNGQDVPHALAVIKGREDMWGKQAGSPPANANALALNFPDDY